MWIFTPILRTKYIAGKATNRTLRENKKEKQNIPGVYRSMLLSARSMRETYVWMLESGEKNGVT